MSLSVKQVGQVSAQLKSQIEQFQQNLDQNDVYISELKEHLEALAGSIGTRERDSKRIEQSLNYSDIFVSSLQQSTSALDNDVMETSRLWESGFSSAPASLDYHGRSFATGRVAFTVPSPFFDRVAERSLVTSGTMDQLTSELAKIEEFYMLQLKEGRKPAEIDEKVRQALVQKVNELKNAQS